MGSNHRMSESKSDALPLGESPSHGADNWIRTSDLHLTKMVHYLCVISANGSGGENRTPIMGFGDPYNAIILHRICLAVSVGFEPTERYKRPTA